MLVKQGIKKKRFLVSVNTLEEEVDYIWDLMSRMKKFKKFGYNLSLPETYEMNSIVTKALENKLTAQDKEMLHLEIAKVYSSDVYAEAFEKVNTCLEIVDNTFSIFDYYETQWGFKIFEKYLIKITQFGPGGSYYYKTGEILMKKSNCIKRPGETIVHEIFHIGIEENIIAKFNIPHQYKERIVDKFVVHHFNDVFQQYRMQRVGDNLVDKYLNHEDSWKRLPYYIKQFEIEQLRN